MDMTETKTAMDDAADVIKKSGNASWWITYLLECLDDKSAEYSEELSLIYNSIHLRRVNGGW